MKSQKSTAGKIINGSLIIIAVSILAKFASFIAESINANYLGSDWRSDAFYTISSIQSVIYPMLSIGISKVFLPVYKRHLSAGEPDKADILANRMITFLAIITASVIALMMIFSEAVVSVVAPGFDEKTRTLCAELVRISSPMYLFIIFASTYSAMLHCHNRFFGSQIREVVSHIPPILCALLLYRRLGAENGIRAMAISLLVGAICRLIIELPFVNWKYRYKPDFSFRDPEFKQTIAKLPPALVSACITELNHLVDRMMASSFAEGAISALHYASKLNNVFRGLLSTAVATAFYPQMVEMITLGEKEKLTRVVLKILNIFCILMIPVTLGCIAFQQPAIEAVYQRGKFTADNTAVTAPIFALYSIGLLFSACSSVLSNIFYGHGDTKRPMYISIIGLGINIGLNLLFSHLMGVKGLALATSVSAAVGMVIRILFVRKYLCVAWLKEGLTVLKILLAAAVSVGTAYFITRPITNCYLLLIAAVVICAGVYLLLTKLMRIETVNDVFALVKHKLKRKK